MSGQEHFSEKHRNTRFSNNVTASMRQNPGIGRILCGTGDNYTGSQRSRIENRFGRLTMQEKTERNSDTDTTELNSVARWIQPGRSKDVAPVVDRDDQMVVDLDLGSPAVKEVADAAEAYHDDMVFKGFFETAYTGVDGNDTVSFKPSNIIAHGGVGLVLPKILATRELMRKRNVNFKKEMPIWIVQPEEVTDLMNIEEYKNADYTGGRPLEDGELKPFGGFRWFEFNPDAESVPESLKHLITDGGVTRQNPIICPRGMHKGTWDEFTGYVDRLPNKRQSMQYFGSSRVAATRTDEDLCFIVQNRTAT